MLDTFLEVAMGHEKVASDQRKLVDTMTELPVEDLLKIASGETKLSFFHGDNEWLEKFKGTPLIDEAIAIEEADLQAQMARTQRRREQSETFKEEDSARDELCVKRRMLDLELAKLDAGHSPEGGGEPEPEVAEEPPPEAVAPEEGGGEAPPEVPPEAPAEAKMAASFRERLHAVEKGTVKKYKKHGGEIGAKRGRKSGAKGGAGYGALGGAVAGAVKGKGGLKGRALSAAAGAAMGGAAGGAAGTGVGHVKGKSRGKKRGERYGHMVNVARRQHISKRISQLAKERKAGGKKKTSSAEDNLKMAEAMGRDLAQSDLEKQALMGKAIPAAVAAGGGLMGAEEGGPGHRAEGAIRGGAGALGGGVLGGAAGGVAGAAKGALPGGAAGVGAGLLASALSRGKISPGVGSAIGGSLGTLGGGLFGGGYGAGTGALKGVQAGYQTAMQPMKERQKKEKEKSKEKKSSVDINLAAAQMKLASGQSWGGLTELEKDAFLPALKAGLAGAAKFVGKAGKGVATAGQKKGVTGAMQAAKGFAGTGARKAVKFTAANPGAGLALGTGAGVVGGAALT